MTENEAKSCIQGKLDCMNKCDVFDCKNTDECDSCFFCYSQGNFGEQKKAFKMAIQALEEIQQYRAIGTVEELKTAMKYVSLAKKHGTVGKTIDSCAEYESIGTIEEFKALKEKNEPKKVDEEYCCPICHTCGMDDDGIAGAYCTECGQKLDWTN